MSNHIIQRALRKLNIPARFASAVHFMTGGYYAALTEAMYARAHQSYDGITFDVSSSLALWRAQTHRTKEPQTIAWIDTFAPGDVLFDVGANVGVFSLYAARHRNVMVYAFEPSPLNFATLCRNVALNKLSDQVSPFCVALSDKTVIDQLHMSSLAVGAAHTGFKTPLNEFGKPIEVVHRQASLGFSMDDFIKIFNLPAPHHIKIDVDGAEAVVVRGMHHTLRDPRLKTVLIELPCRVGDQLPALLQDFVAAGFVVAREDHPDGDARLSNYLLKRA
ncbi:MAG TPA: FkbM family methyltransferase [Micavibrio sp.]